MSLKDGILREMEWGRIRSISEDNAEEVLAFDIESLQEFLKKELKCKTQISSNVTNNAIRWAQCHKDSQGDS